MSSQIGFDLTQSVKRAHVIKKVYPSPSATRRIMVAVMTLTQSEGLLVYSAVSSSPVLRLRSGQAGGEGWADLAGMRSFTGVMVGVERFA